MRIVINISEEEIKKLNEAVGGIPEDIQKVTKDDIIVAIHTLIDVCM